MGSIGSTLNLNTSIPKKEYRELKYLNVGDIVDNIVRVIHYTPEANIQSLLNSEFDMSRSGEGAGAVWGDGAYYLEQGGFEDSFYKNRLKTDSYIQSDVDTSGFLEIKLENDKAYHVGDMYETASKNFTQEQQKEYRKLKKQYKDNGVYSERANREAFVDVAKQNYNGLIIKHTIHKNGQQLMDPISGGTQVVVYNQSHIRNKKAGRNK